MLLCTAMVAASVSWCSSHKSSCAYSCQLLVISEHNATFLFFVHESAPKVLDKPGKAFLNHLWAHFNVLL